ncbi:MAG: SufE family protein [Amoebophilaceae bacterium]|jgi:cysteine desulfuration protein SufE|nr:SufE family protein [Amoebophilaceae bacterium]
MQNATLPTISAIQEEIIREFQTLEHDRERMLTYIMDLGDRLEPMDALFKNEHNTIRGCISKVWLTYTRKGDLLFFEGDSNTAITKGLISLLLRVLSGQKIEDIIHANLYFVGKIGMTQLLGFQRSNGFANMLKEMKLIAIAQKTKQKA